MNKIILTEDDLRSYARYEKTFEQYQPFDCVDDVFEVKGNYKISLDDIYNALKTALKDDPTIDEFFDNWLTPLFQLEEYLGIYYEYDQDEISEENVKQKPEVRYLPLEEDYVFMDIWSNLDYIWDTDNEGKQLSQLPEYIELIDEIERFYRNNGKPVEEMEFTDKEKESFIRYIGYGDIADDVSDKELELCRKYTDELCGKDSVIALDVKGYACYGGNRLYDCDWKISRDCMIKLLDLTDNAQYANTLGYIYYYGRCTDGVPEYGKAYEMYTFAAANGLYEGMFKLADMYLHGYACKKSPRTANNLYSMVYHDCYKKMLKGQIGNFPDAALRMGNVFLKGIDAPEIPEQAYRYYLQADMAAKDRANNNDFFGYTTVALNVKKALDEAKKKLPEDYWKEYMRFNTPDPFEDLIRGNWLAKVSAVESKESNITLKATRISNKAEYDADPIMYTFGPINYCGIQSEIELIAVEAESSLIESAEAVVFDEVDYDYDNDRICFNRNGETAAWVKCKEFRFYPPKENEPSGDILKFVSIAFQDNGRTYDYLCNISGIQIGDKVIVPGYDGEKEVEVKDIFEKHESELGLPLERYKKVIRKA